MDVQWCSLLLEARRPSVIFLIVMSLRRQRTHNTGVSNADFRIREDWKHLRSLRPSLHESKRKYHEEQLGIHGPKSPTVDLTRSHASLTQEAFYKTAGKPIKTHPVLSRTQTSPLKGMNMFVGGDNDPFIYKAHRGLKATEGMGQSAEGMKRAMGKYYKTKDVEHKQAIQETQLVHMEHEETLEGKVDLEKVVDIRRTIRRRYANRSNFRSIFNQWDRDSLGVIRPQDIHFMVNQLGIPINIDEARVLVASANQSASGALNLDEFLQLIFDDSNRLNVDLSSMKAVEDPTPGRNPQQYSETMLADLHELAVNQHTRLQQEQLKLHIKERMSDVTGQMLKMDKSRSGIVSFDSFCEVMNNLTLPHSVSNEKLWNLLYTEYGGKEDGLLYRDFIKQINSFVPTEEANDRFQIGELSPQNPLLAKRALMMKLAAVPAGPTILDPQRVPVNKIEAILEKSRRICTFFKEQFPEEKLFREALEAKSGGTIVSQEKLREFVMETAGKEPGFAVTKAEVNNFLSRYIYNQQKQTSVQGVAFNIYNDDVRADTSLQRRVRAIPPTVPPATDPSQDASSTQLKRVLHALDEKLFTQGVLKSYPAYKTFDSDNDGYISFEDLRKGLTTLNIPHSEAEARALMRLLDDKGKGYVEFHEFASVIKPNTVYHNAVKMGEKPPKYPNYVQPSKEFLDTQLERTGEVNKAYEELRMLYKPSETTFDLKPSSRFGSTPSHKDTFGSFVPPEDAGMYLDAKSRFLGKNQSPINIGSIDKDSKQSLQEATTKRIRNTLTNFHQRISQQDEKLERMDEAKVGHKAAFREQYEKVSST